MKTKSELLLHPVRMKLIVELGNRQMTTRQLADALPDVAQATLYRQIKTLHEGGIIYVVSETEIKGAIERTFELVPNQNRLMEGEIAEMSAEENVNAFSVFTANLIEQFSAYTTKSSPSDYVTEGLSYNQAVIYLSPEEKREFEEKLDQVVGEYLGKARTLDRQKYTIASIVIPDKKDPK